MKQTPRTIRTSGERVLPSVLALALAAALVFGGAGTVLAQSPDTPCENHPQHDTECGYVAAAEETSCGHVHDESCGEGGASCTHTAHDETCGYVPAVEGAPCIHTCEVCDLAVDPPGEPAQVKTVAAFAALPADIQFQAVEEGAKMTALALPGELEATIAEQTETITGVTWACEAYDEQTGMVAGEYEWRAVLPEGYAPADGVEPPSILALAGSDGSAAEAIMAPMVANKIINSFDALNTEIAYQTLGQGAVPNYPDSLTATVNNVPGQSVPVNWIPPDGYDPNSPPSSGAYVWTCEIADPGYTLAAGMKLPTITAVYGTTADVSTEAAMRSALAGNADVITVTAPFDMTGMSGAMGPFWVDRAVTITSSLGGGQAIGRADGYTDSLFAVNTDKGLKLTGIVLDGAAAGNAVAPLVRVNAGGSLELAAGAVLRNNNNTKPNGRGGGVVNDGSVTLSGASLYGNHADFGGAIYMGAGTRFTATSGTIGGTGNGMGNSARWGGGIQLSEGSTSDISNITVVGNHAIENGGGINVFSALNISSKAALTLKYSRFEQNTANGNGGAIYNQGSLNVEGCSFGETGAGNEADFGGAIWNESDRPAKITDCEFINNTARQDGGGVYNNSEMIIEGCVFGKFPEAYPDAADAGNQAANGGGAYNGENGSLVLDGGGFYYNLATTGDGGGVCNLAGASFSLQLTASDFKNNAAPHGNGGGVYNMAADLAVKTVNFIQNTARNGGGLYTVWRVMFEDARLEGNRASEDGGGVFGSSQLVFNGLFAVGNKAEGGSGGGVFSQGDVLFDDWLHAENNLAEEDGGFVCASSVLVNITDPSSANSLIQNTAGDGGGAIAAGTAVTVSGNVLFSKNSADGFGGAIASYGQVDIGKSVSLVGNRTDGFGGGVCVVQAEKANPAGLKMAGTLKDNVAGMTGGGVALFSFLNGQAVSARFTSGSAVTGNTAGTYGGGVFAMAMAGGILEVNLDSGAAITGNKANNNPDALFFTASDAQVPDDDLAYGFMLPSRADQTVPATASQSFLRLSGTPTVEGVITLAYKQPVRITGALQGANLQMASYAVLEDPRAEATLIPFQRYDLVATGEGYAPTAVDLAQFSLYQPADPGFFLRLDGNNIIVDFKASDFSSSGSAASPQTGDGATLGLWMVLALVAVGTLAALLALARRHRAKQ